MEHSLFQFVQYGFSWEAYVFTCLWFWVQVDAEQLQFLIDSQEAGFDSPSALQSQNLDDLDEEDVIDFADSLPIAPDEYGVEIPPHLLNDYIPPTPRSSSHAYVLDSSDREAYLAYGEVIENL